MKEFCHLHPTEPAQWHCDRCHFDYCSGCIEVRAMDGYAPGRKMYMCPKCNVEVEWLGVKNVIEPFWKRLPLFFLYPFHYRPLGLILVLAFLQHLFSGAGLITALLSIGLWGLLIKYCYESLKLTARGNLAPPGINQQTLADDFGIVFKQYAIYIVIGILFGLLSRFLTPFVGIFFLVLAIVFLPSMIMLLITTNSVIHALNPMLFVPLATRIGWGYLAMCFFLVLLLLAPATLLGYFVRSGEPSLFLEFLYLTAN
jgi:hypothetical protein